MILIEMEGYLGKDESMRHNSGSLGLIEQRLFCRADEAYLAKSLSPAFRAGMGDNSSESNSRI